MAATLLTAPTATPNQPETSLVLTSGSTVRIHAPASKVFDIILNTTDYETWNTTSPRFTFSEHESIRQVGAVGTLRCYMATMKRNFEVPVKILEVSSSAERCVLAWRGQLMPGWFGVAERVQTVRSISETECELKQHESMSGWGVTMMKCLLRIDKELNYFNMLYAEELKAYAEKLEMRQ